MISVQNHTTMDTGVCSFREVFMWSLFATLRAYLGGFVRIDFSDGDRPGPFCLGLTIHYKSAPPRIKYALIKTRFGASPIR